MRGITKILPPLPFPWIESVQAVKPTVTTSLPEFDAQFLATDQDAQRVRMEVPGWIQYAFDEPFLCRSITITPDGNNFQAHRLLLQASDDGEAFHTIGTPRSLRGMAGKMAMDA